MPPLGWILFNDKSKENHQNLLEIKFNIPALWVTERGKKNKIRKEEPFLIQLSQVMVKSLRLRWPRHLFTALIVISSQYWSFTSPSTWQTIITFWATPPGAWRSFVSSRHVRWTLWEISTPRLNYQAKFGFCFPGTDQFLNLIRIRKPWIPNPNWTKSQSLLTQILIPARKRGLLLICMVNI